MKQLILIFFVCSLSFAQEVSVQFEKANQLYRNGEYQNAVTMYEQVLKNGYENATVYYNLGNAYFKTQNISASILNYEKAKRLAPRDEDIFYNLRLANLRVVDKIEPIPRLFFIEWWYSFLNLFPSESWAVIAIVCLWLTVISGALFLLLRSILFQRVLFAIALISILICILSFVGTFQQRQIESNQQLAIVFSQSVSVKSAPDAQSTDLFVIHDGVKVELLDSVGEWKKIRLADGKIGWLPEATIRII
jgi:tetratricopeptide (TPR) repeat protein